MKKISENILRSKLWVWNQYLSPKAGSIWKDNERKIVAWMLVLTAFLFGWLLTDIIIDFGYERIWLGIFKLSIILIIVAAPFLFEHTITIVPWIIYLGFCVNIIGWCYFYFLNKKYPIKDPYEKEVFFFDDTVNEFIGPYRIKINKIMFEDDNGLETDS